MAAHSSTLAIAGLILALVTSAQAVAGSWMRYGGEYFYSTGLTYSTADRFFNNDSRRVDSSCTSSDFYNDHSIEYGYSYYRTLFARTSLARKSCGSESNSEIGDVEVGVRGRINLLRNGRSWEAALIIPTGNGSIDPANLGVGEFGVQLGAFGRFDAGGSVEYPNFLRLGAELRLLLDSDVPDRFRTSVEYEQEWAEFDVGLGLKGDYSIQEASSSEISANDGVSDDFDEVSARLSVSHKVGEWSVGYHLSQVLWGRNIAASSSFGVTFGITWEE